jgi:hypothetical protein
MSHPLHVPDDFLNKGKAMRQTIAIETFGAFPAETFEPTALDQKIGREHLTLVFSPSSIPLEERWRTHQLSAAFLADYFSTFLPISSLSTTFADPQSTAIHSITFIANEMLENAMKFSDADGEESITLTICLDVNRLLFWAKNSIVAHHVKPFQRLIQHLLTQDTMDLYIQKVEHNATLKTLKTSGLGLLTIMNDYTPLIGWQFKLISNTQTQVTTKVELPI